MKNLAVLLFAILHFSSCSQIKENDNPIIGIWHSQISKGDTDFGIPIDQKEWVFNDAFLGRFHGYYNGQIVYRTDYLWRFSEEENTYTIEYLGTDFVRENLRLALNDDNNEVLMTVNGQIRAFRQ